MTYGLLVLWLGGWLIGPAGAAPGAPTLTVHGTMHVVMQGGQTQEIPLSVQVPLPTASPSSGIAAPQGLAPARSSALQAPAMTAAAPGVPLAGFHHTAYDGGPGGPAPDGASAGYVTDQQIGVTHVFAPFPAGVTTYYEDWISPNPAYNTSSRGTFFSFAYTALNYEVAVSDGPLWLFHNWTITYLPPNGDPVVLVQQASVPGWMAFYDEDTFYTPAQLGPYMGTWRYAAQQTSGTWALRDIRIDALALVPDPYDPSKGPAQLQATAIGLPLDANGQPTWTPGPTLHWTGTLVNQNTGQQVLSFDQTTGHQLALAWDGTVGGGVVAVNPGSGGGSGAMTLAAAPSLRSPTLLAAAPAAPTPGDLAPVGTYDLTAVVVDDTAKAIAQRKTVAVNIEHPYLETYDVNQGKNVLIASSQSDAELSATGKVVTQQDLQNTILTHEPLIPEPVKIIAHGISANKVEVVLKTSKTGQPDLVFPLTRKPGTSDWEANLMLGPMHIPGQQLRIQLNPQGANTTYASIETIEGPGNDRDTLRFMSQLASDPPYTRGVFSGPRESMNIALPDADWKNKEEVLPSANAFRSMGFETVTATLRVDGTDKDTVVKFHVKNQASVFYFSGHGHHEANYLTIAAGVPLKPTVSILPSDVDDNTKILIIAGCSVLDIGGYNFFLNGGGNQRLSPGVLWDQLFSLQAGNKVLLGYDAGAPQGPDWDTKILIDFFEHLKQGDVMLLNPIGMRNNGTPFVATIPPVAAAWLESNAENDVFDNACAITQNAFYFILYKPGGHADWLGRFKIKHVQRKIVAVPRGKWEESKAWTYDQFAAYTIRDLDIFPLHATP